MGTAQASATTSLPETARLLSRAERRLTGRIVAVLRDASIEQWRTLMLLSDGGGHSMAEIARYAMVPAASLTRLIDRMVSDNLVYRTVDPADRRRVLVRLAPRGERLRRQLAARVGEARDGILGDADEQDLERLAVLLAELVERLERRAG